MRHRGAGFFFTHHSKPPPGEREVKYRYLCIAMDKGVQKSQRSGQTLQFYEVEMGEGLTLPYAEEGIFAGFPSPAQDDRLESIDLNRELIRHPATTFLARIVGDSMEGANIYEGDIVVVDRALEVHDDDVVVCCVNGEFNIKFVERRGDVAYLISANNAYPPMRVDPEDDFILWGVVTYVIHRPRRI